MMRTDSIVDKEPREIVNPRGRKGGLNVDKAQLMLIVRDNGKNDGGRGKAPFPFVFVEATIGDEQQQNTETEIDDDEKGVQEVRRLHWHMLPIEGRSQHRGADGKDDNQRPYRAMQGPHPFQAEPVAPEEHPQTNSQRKRNDIVDNDVLGKAEPCGEVDEKDWGNA